MINAEIYVDKFGNNIGFCISGHSGYAEAGSDIVCAAVSSAAYMTANIIIDIHKVDADVSVNDGFMKLRILSQDAALCSVILSGFKQHLCSLEEQYPDYLIVNYLEV